MLQGEARTKARKGVSPKVLLSGAVQISTWHHVYSKDILWRILGIKSFFYNYLNMVPAFTVPLYFLECVPESTKMLF
jgi:hypothetical protein